MIILVVNLAIAVALALIDIKFVISFEVAFVGALLVFYSSYKAVAKKINDYSAIMGVDSANLAKDSGESSESSADSSANLRSDSGNLGESGGDSHKDSANLIDSSVDSPKDSIDSSDDLQDLQDSQDSPKDSSDNLPKKERFFIGFKVSFGLLRLLSYAFIALSIITLINNGAFALIPFLLGILISTLSTAFYAIKKAKS